MADAAWTRTDQMVDELGARPASGLGPRMQLLSGDFAHLLAALTAESQRWTGKSVTIVSDSLSLLLALE
jgi:hypothetical protein